MNVYHSQIQDVVEVFEFSPTQKEESDARVIYVPRDAVAFAIGVGRTDGEIFARAENVTVSVTQNGRPLTSEGAIADIEDGNVRAYMSDTPPSGEWMVRISHRTADAFVVSVAVFRKPLRALFLFANNHRCKACKISVRALIFALLSHLTAGAIHALSLGDLVEQLVHLAQEVVEFLAKSLGITAEALRELLGQLGEIAGFETPWAWLARRICEWLGLCPVGGSADD
jgi:hypothetical protein